MNIERPSEKNLFMAIYKHTSIISYNDEMCVFEEGIEYHKFFTKVPSEGITVGDVEQMNQYRSGLYSLLGSGCISPPPTILLDEIDRIDKWMLEK